MNNWDKKLELKKPTQRTNDIIKELLELKYISYNTKLPSYKQICYYILENYKSVEEIRVRDYRASHDTHNSSGKIIIKTTRSNERIVDITFNTVDKHGAREYKKFDSNKLWRLNESLFDYIKERLEQ